MREASSNQALTYNERIESGLKFMQQGEFANYTAASFSSSYFENPIQIIARHRKHGRLKIANIYADGLIGWDSDTIPWV